jgi:two-component system LytT family response regulator
MLHRAIPQWAIRPSDCKTTFIGWGAYMSYLAIYCLLYTGVVESAPIELAASFLWVLREWGIWLMLTPLVCTGLRALHTSTRNYTELARLYLLLSVAALGVALSYRVAIDVYGGAGLAASVIYFFPKYATALILIVLAWHLTEIKRSPAGSEAVSGTNQPSTTNAMANTSVADITPMPSTLLVSTGQHETLIRIEEIDVLSAAGNYVDIHCKNNVYLLRSSLKQLEETLPAQQFVRVHRSHLVNLDALLHITRTAAGNGSVVLRGGQQVPISKKYRTLLKQTACALPEISA